MNKKQLIFSIILKSLIIIIGIVGQIVNGGVGDFMKDYKYLYYTNISNCWTIAITFLFLIFDIISLIKNQPLKISHIVLSIRFMLVFEILITFSVFTILLAPQLIKTGYISYLFSLANLCVHIIVPILAIIDWYIYTYNYKPKKFDFLLAIIPPFAYMVFALSGSYLGLMFGTNQKVPYFFLDYKANTWFKIQDGKIGVFYWILILASFIILFSYLYILIYKKIRKK